MNYTYLPLPSSVHRLHLPPTAERASQDLIKLCAFALIPTELLYFSIYFLIKQKEKTYKTLTSLSLTAFWISSYVAPIACGPLRCLQNFSIAIGTMKLLDIYARRDSLPRFSVSKTRPPDWLLALIVLTELRYESFTPNHIRIPKDQENFNEPLQLGIHITAFTLLQALPQSLPTVLAFEVLLAIYIIWTCLQQVLRYKSSPALFGPLYRADSLSGFWSETWHNAFASPCTSLAYAPLRNGLPKLGVPEGIARSIGVLGAFTLMAVFHMYALYPILTDEALFRIGVFFFLNGMGTICEGAIWGKRRHWGKAVLAWCFETVLASWTAGGMNIPNGLSRIPWRELCDA